MLCLLAWWTGLRESGSREIRITVSRGHPRCALLSVFGLPDGWGRVAGRDAGQEAPYVADGRTCQWARTCVGLSRAVFIHSACRSCCPVAFEITHSVTRASSGG